MCVDGRKRVGIHVRVNPFYAFSYFLFEHLEGYLHVDHIEPDLECNEVKAEPVSERTALTNVASGQSLAVEMTQRPSWKRITMGMAEETIDSNATYTCANVQTSCRLGLSLEVDIGRLSLGV